MSHISRRFLRPLFIAVLSALLSTVVVVAQGGNCNGILNSADNHSADWNNWDSYVERLNSRGCEYTDIGIQMTATASPVEIGDTLNYVIVVSNNGTEAVDEVSFFEQIPAEFSLVSVDGDFGTTDGVCVFTPALNQVECTFADVAPDAQLTIYLEAEADLPGTVESTVTLNDVEGDIDPRNNSSSATATINEP